MTNDQATVSHLMERLRGDAQKSEGRPEGHELTTEAVPLDLRNESIGRLLPQEDQERPSAELIAAPGVTESFKVSADRIYRLENFLKYHDRQFIDAAYRAVLLRPPDRGGFEAYLNHLRNGLSKAEILHILRESSEGQTANVRIIGLRSRLFWSRLLALPIAGPILAFSRGVWRTPNLEVKSQALEGRLFASVEHSRASAQQSMSAANAAIRNLNEVTSRLTAQVAARASRDEVVSMANSLRQTLSAVDVQWNVRMKEHDQALSKVDTTLMRLSNIKADVASLDALMIELQSGILSKLTADVGRSLQAAEALSRSKAELNSTDAVIAEHSVLLRKLSGQVREIGDALNAVSERNSELKRSAQDQERRLLLLLEEARKRLPEPISPEQIRAMVSEEDHILDAMYSSFEDKFRGSREAIRAYQRDYLPYVLKAGAGTDGSPVIDLGCGRGEWLEVLHSQGLKAQGIDINRVFLDGCRQLNLDVVEAEAVSFLRGVKPRSIGAITSFHLIEHLPRKTLIALLDESIRVLKPGGVIILETPNPENLLVGAYKFYYDPTHIRPLPPASTRFLVESRGFVNVTTQDLHPDDHYASLKSETPKLADHFSNGQDYMIIGWKA